MVSTTPSRKSRSCVISSSVPGYFAEPVLEPQHGVEVEVVGRLVEQQQVRAAHQRLREVEAHPPAAGKARDRIRVPRFGKAQAGQQRRGARARAVAADVVEAVMQVGQRFAVECAWSRSAAASAAFDLAQFAVAVEHVVDRRHLDGRRLLRDVRDRPRRRQVDRAGVGQQFVADGGEEARLAAAVRADEPDLVAGVDRQVGAFEQALGAAGEREIGDAQHRLTEARSRSR